MRNKRIALILIAIILGIGPQARGQDDNLPQNHVLRSKVAMIGTHHSYGSDGNLSAKPGAESVIKFCRSHNFDTVYLKGYSALYLEQSPTFEIASEAGEFKNLSNIPDDVILTGGYFRACQWQTALQILRGWEKPQPQEKSHVQTLYFVTTAIFTEPQDPVSLATSLDNLSFPDTPMDFLFEMILYYYGFGERRINKSWHLLDYPKKVVLHYRGKERVIHQPTEQKDRDANNTVVMEFIHPENDSENGASVKELERLLLAKKLIPSKK